MMWTIAAISAPALFWLSKCLLPGNSLAALKKQCLAFLLGLIVAGAISPPLLAAQQKPFDFYVLSLSWSPEFCQNHPKERQCGRGYGVVLHGVWPQFKVGYPESCSGAKMPAKIVREFAGLYPNEKLAFHEWQKHGTCSGLAPRDYMQFSQQLKQGFTEPAALKNLSKPLRISAAQLNQEIVNANPVLNNQAVSFSCTGGGRFLQEIYLCLDKSGTQPVACGTDMQQRSRRSCGQKDFLIRNIR
ncbi:MAG: ribonuclease [Methylococcales bacterium]